MRIRIIWMVTLLMVASVLALALPKIEVYRYTVKDFKTVSIESVLHPLTGFNPWILDDAPWPKDKKILLLVHGFPFPGASKLRLTMNGLAVYFSKERKNKDITLPAYDVIYAVEYPRGYSLYESEKALVGLIDQATSLFSKGQKCDIFNHSLGGLPIRAAIEWPNNKSIVDKIGHVVFMGTPHNGFTVDELDCFKKGLDLLPVEVSDLNPDGLLINMLNSTDNKKPVDCNYYSIVGLRSWAPDKFGKSMVGGPLAKVIKNMQDKNFPVHDGLISSESAGFNLSPYCKSFKLITLDLNHEYINNHQWVFEAIDKWMIDDKWFGGYQSQVQIVKPKIEKFTGGLPTVLNRSRQEVVKLFGNNCGRRDMSGFLGYSPKADNIEDTTEWYYVSPMINNIYFSSHIYFVSYSVFSRFGPDFGSKTNELSNRVQTIIYQSIRTQKGFPLVICSPVSPKLIVAKEILEQEPSEICWYYEGGRKEIYGLVIIWKINGDTYVLIVKADNFDLVDVKKLDDKNHFRVSKNKNTSRFREVDTVVTYSQINGDINFFGGKYDWESNASYIDPEMDFNNRGYFDGYRFFRFFNK